MKIHKVFRSLIVQASILTILLIGLCVAPSKSQLIGTLPRTDISLPGAHGATNNTVFAFDRYVIVAPFGPSGEVGDGSDLSRFDNNIIYLFDTKKPEAAPKTSSLGNCYFPTKVVYDPVSGNVFVRGTEYIEIGPGQFESNEVLVHTRLNPEADGKPAFDPDFAVPIRIKGRDSDYSSDAPIDFALGHGGKILVFTNGSSIFTYDVIRGRFYPVVIDHSPDNRISHLDVDEVGNTIIAATSRRIEEGDGRVRYSSELYFYKLEKDGTVNSILRLLPGDFPEGIFLSEGSNAAISWDPNTETAEYGYFVTNDGSVYQVDLRAQAGGAVIERVAILPEMAQAENLEPGPVTVKYDRAKRLLTVVKRGTFSKIRRPSYAERSGRIRRPSYVEYEGSAAVALVQFNKKNRVIGQKVFDKVFGKENRISNLVAGQGSVGLVSTYSGLLFTFDSSLPLDRASVSFIGEIGERIDHISYIPGRQSLTAISSYQVDDETQRVLPGSIRFAKVALNSE